MQNEIIIQLLVLDSKVMFIFFFFSFSFFFEFKVICISKKNNNRYSSLKIQRYNNGNMINNSWPSKSSYFEQIQSEKCKMKWNNCNSIKADTIHSIHLLNSK